MKNKIIRSYRQALGGTRREIFSLLCPVREREWLKGWDYNMIYSESGFAEKGCIFETDNDYGGYLWLITKHDSYKYEIQFVKSLKDKLIMIIDIYLEEKDKSLTFCNIQYTFIPMVDGAFEHIPTEDQFRTHMKIWEDSLIYFLKNGEMLMS